MLIIFREPSLHECVVCDLSVTVVMKIASGHSEKRSIIISRYVVPVDCSSSLNKFIYLCLKRVSRKPNVIIDVRV